MDVRRVPVRRVPVLDAGDTLVVRGGRHAWSNRTSEVVTLATVAVAPAR